MTAQAMWELAAQLRQAHNARKAAALRIRAGRDPQSTGRWLP